MPYQPYDTGWIKSIHGILCLTWFLLSHGTLAHLAAVTCYNNIFIPFIGLFNKSCELMGNVIVSCGIGIIRCESIIFKQFNYINPIYNGLKYIKSIVSNIDLDIGTPTFHCAQYNTRSNKTSTGKHLCSYFARKRRRRKRHVISVSYQSKNDDHNNYTHKSATMFPSYGNIR
jgi:hypothetical protein